MKLNQKLLIKYFMTQYQGQKEDYSPTPNTKRRNQEYRQPPQKQLKMYKNLKQQTSKKNSPYKRIDSAIRKNTIQSENSERTRRLLSEESQFLPSIQGHRNKRYSHRRNASEGPPEQSRRMSYPFRQIQTLSAITECEIIIQNLRKLRVQSLNEIKKKMENIKMESERKDRRALKPLRQQLSEESDFFQEKQERISVIKKRKKKKSFEQNSYNQQRQQPSEDEPGSKNEEKEGQEEEKEQFEKNEQQQKAKKKQKILLKYLGKVRVRGSNLQEKILKFRNRNKEDNSDKVKEVEKKVERSIEIVGKIEKNGPPKENKK